MYGILIVTIVAWGLLLMVFVFMCSGLSNLSLTMFTSFSLEMYRLAFYKTENASIMSQTAGLESTDEQTATSPTISVHTIHNTPWNIRVPCDVVYNLIGKEMEKFHYHQFCLVRSHIINIFGLNNYFKYYASLSAMKIRSFTIEILSCNQEIVLVNLTDTNCRRALSNIAKKK